MTSKQCGKLRTTERHWIAKFILKYQTTLSRSINRAMTDKMPDVNTTT